MTRSDPAARAGDAAATTVPLGSVDPARSRHAGRRSAVALVADPDGRGPLAVAGLADGTLLAVDPTGTARWRHTPDDPGSVVTAVPFAGGVLVGERGTDGTVRLHDAATGALRWRHRSAADVGDPTRDSRFFLPFVVDAAVADGRAYVAARRYERGGGDADRSFESVLYAFDSGGRVAWCACTDASPIAVDAAAGHVAVAYNRCPGAHDDGLVVLDTDGDERLRWDPGDAMAAAPGERRVGDVSLTPAGPVVASHADYRGYALGPDGAVRWRIDLARPVERPAGDGVDTVYAYPNHVHATDAGALFVTGNSYPETGRETEARHPDEHTAVGVRAGEARWRTGIGGFATGLDTDGSRVAVPSAQHFRDRDAAGHGLRTLDVGDGPRRRVGTEGVVTAVALDGGTVAAVEEPVVYHDEGREHGAYRLLLDRTG
jgi:hypothetical protein